jgi:uncharacterized protein (DUF58 family)
MSGEREQVGGGAKAGRSRSAQVRPLRLPREGRSYLLVTLVVIAIGLGKGINLLLLLGYALAVLAGLNLLAASRALHGFRVRRRLSDPVFAQTPCAMDVQVNNLFQHPRPPLTLEDQESEQRWSQVIPPLAGQAVHTFRREMVLSRRGRHQLGPVVGVSTYPFGLIQRRVVLADNESLVALPRVGWLHRGRFLRHLRSLGPQAHQIYRRRPQAHPAAQAEFHGLRGYRGGDSPRLIHWRTSARRGELMVREFEDVPGDHLLVVLDPTLPPGPDAAGVSPQDQFEQAITLTATICWGWCRRRGDRLILATLDADGAIQVLDGLTGPVHARRVLECLALLAGSNASFGAPLFTRLRPSGLSSLLVVLVAVGWSPWVETLEQTLRRPVNCLDVRAISGFDFYVPPGSSDRPLAWPPDRGQPDGRAAAAEAR